MVVLIGAKFCRNYSAPFDAFGGADLCQVARPKPIFRKILGEGAPFAFKTAWNSVSSNLAALFQ